MQRQAIKNTTFENEYDTGKAVSNGTVIYNKKHTGIMSINNLHKDSICIFT
jgi:hypothetical protein